MGHNEEASPYLARAGFERREHARFDRVAQSAKVCEDAGGAQSEVSFDVFEEAPFGPELVGDAPDMGPEVARVVFAASSACE